MAPAYRGIVLEQIGDVTCARMRSHKMDEPDIVTMIDELVDLVTKQGCRKLVLSVGPGEVNCLYSVFLAKLVMLRRVVVEHGGVLKLADATLTTLGVFAACQLDRHFDFAPDRETAIAALQG